MTHILSNPAGSSVNGHGMHLYLSARAHDRVWGVGEPDSLTSQKSPDDSLQCSTVRFSETEATVILAMLVSRYKIEVKEEAQFSGETFEQRKERILKARPGLTLTCARIAPIMSIGTTANPRL